MRKRLTTMLCSCCTTNLYSKRQLLLSALANINKSRRPHAPVWVFLTAHADEDRGDIITGEQYAAKPEHVCVLLSASDISKKDHIIYGPCRPYICSQGQYWAGTTIYAILWASTTIYSIIWAGTKPYISQQEMQCHILCVKEYLCIK